MPRNSVREIFGAEFCEFKKSKSSVNSTDDFGFAHVFYDINNACVAIELFDECVVSVGTACLMPCDRQSFCDWLKTVDRKAEIQNEEATSVALSIGATFAGGKIESILFAKEGYYA
jgi:hypothetical protein